MCYYYDLLFAVLCFDFLNWVVHVGLVFRRFQGLRKWLEAFKISHACFSWVVADTWFEMLSNSESGAVAHFLCDTPHPTPKINIRLNVNPVSFVAVKMLFCWVNLKKKKKSNFLIRCTLWCDCFNKLSRVRRTFWCHICVEWHLITTLMSLCSLYILIQRDLNRLFSKQTYCLRSARCYEDVHHFCDYPYFT